MQQSLPARATKPGFLTDDPAARRPYRALSPDEDLKFRIAQTKLETAFRATGDSRAPGSARSCTCGGRDRHCRAGSCRRSARPFSNRPATRLSASGKGCGTSNAISASANLLRIPATKPGRRKTEYTTAQALALARGRLRGTPAFAALRTIRNSYDKVRRDLRRRGRRSEFYLYVSGGADPLFVDLTV